METVLLYVRQILGFMLQTVPCVWLCLLPIDEQDLRMGKRRCMAVSTLWFAVTGLLFAWVVDTYRWEFTIPGGHNFYMLGVLVVFVVAYCLVVRINAAVKIFLLGIVVVYEAFINISSNMIANVMGLGITLGEPYNDVFFYLVLALTAGTYPLLLRGLGKRLHSFIYKKNLKMLKKYVILLVLSNIAFLFLLTIIASVVSGPSQYGYVFFCFLCGLIMLICLYWFVMELAIQETEYMEYQAQMNVLNLQFAKIQSEVSGVRRQNHDIRHHARLLKQLLEEREYEKALDYLKRAYEGEERKITNIYCREPLLNALLQYYAGLAREAEIRCDIQTELTHCPIENRDMTILVGNCLENAITACRKVESGKRHLTLRIREVNDTLAVVMENSCKEVRLSERCSLEEGFLPAEAFLSTRPGGGMGLRSIANIAKKYDGSAEFRYEDQIFYTRILLELWNQNRI